MFLDYRRCAGESQPQLNIFRTYAFQSFDLSGTCQIPDIWLGYGAISVKNGS